MIYADHCATTPCLPEAIAAVTAALATCGNPSARQHQPGRAAQAMVDAGRADIAALLRVRDSEIIFTSGATEACNLALLGTAVRLLAQRPQVAATAVEHAAVLEPLRALEPHGAQMVVLPVLPTGDLDLAAARRLISERTALVACMLVNNQTGVIHPVAELAEIAHRHGALLICDATQAPLRMPVDLPALGADLAAISAHKLGGPPGIGALWLRRGLSLEPLLHGGGHERGLRPGSLNVPGIAGFAVAARLARERCDERQRHLAQLTQRLEQRVQRELPDVIIHGSTCARAPGISMLTLPGLRPGWLAQLPSVAASAGSACSSGTGEPSHVLTALGLSRDDARNSIRISVGPQSTDDDVDIIANEVIAGAGRIRSPD